MARALSTAEQEVRSRWDDDKGHDDGAQQREGLGVGEWLEELALSPLHREHRQEAHNRRENGRHHSPTNLCGSLVDALEPFLGTLSAGDVLENVLGEHDAHIDHRADCNGDARESNDVGIDPEALHRDEADEHR